MAVSSVIDSDFIHKSETVEAASLQRALDFERRRSQGLEAELAALRDKINSPMQSFSNKNEDVRQISALGVMRDAMVATKFNSLRTVIPVDESFTGSRNVFIPWEEVTPRSVIHVSACEAAEQPKTALEDQIGTPGDAAILVRGAICGNGIVVVNIFVDWVKPLPVLINITLLSNSSQFAFCNVQPQKSILATPELESLFHAQIHNLIEIDVGSDEEFVQWAYQRILGRAADEDGKTHWLQSIQQGQVTRAQIITELVKSEEHELKNANSMRT